MARKKQPRNEPGDDPKKAAEARKKFHALFKDADDAPATQEPVAADPQWGARIKPETPAAPFVLPWKAEDIRELAHVHTMLKDRENRGVYSGDFDAPPNRESIRSVPREIQMRQNAFARATSALEAAKLELTLHGREFSYTIRDPQPNPKNQVDRRGWIFMDKGMHELLGEFIRDLQKAAREGKLPTTPPAQPPMR